uniref:Uncharacterized protein n=1 Tax=Rhizophora mucronata TaxID=61149 RepID=A0A2P2IV93_RHIMU
MFLLKRNQKYRKPDGKKKMGEMYLMK